MKNIKLLFCLLMLCFLCGCAQEAETSTTSTKTSELATEIPLENQSAAYFTYNPKLDRLSIFQKNKNTYTVSTLQPDLTWKKSSTTWTTSGDRFLANFTYAADGSLYAAEKHYNAKGLTVQKFIKLKKNGKIQKIKIKNLNQVPSTNIDTTVKNNGYTMDHSITDIHISGSTAAFTYSNFAVKLYDLKSGQAIGSHSLIAEHMKNTLTDNQYIIASQTNRSYFLDVYNTATGQKERTIAFGTEENDMTQFYLTSNQENLYVLSDDGIYKGSPEATTLTRFRDFKTLGFPSEITITSFHADRTGTLYMECLDDKSIQHLYRFK